MEKNTNLNQVHVVYQYQLTLSELEKATNEQLERAKGKSYSR